MKRIFTLSTLLLAGFFAQAQCQTKVDHSRVVVGNATPTAEVYDGLFEAKYRLQEGQIALVAGQPCTAAYYAVYDEEYRVVIACGVFSKLKAGEVEIVKVGRPAEKCHVVVSVSPSIVKQ